MLVVHDDAAHPGVRAARVVDHEVEHVVLVVPADGTVGAGVPQRRLEQGVQEVEAGLVGGEPGARAAHAAEPADGHVAGVGA